MMNRNDRRILALAKKRGWKTTDKPNKLHQIKQETAPEKRPKINPVGHTILVKDNEVLFPEREKRSRR
jgi:hypothetical protein